MIGLKTGKKINGVSDLGRVRYESRSGKEFDLEIYRNKMRLMTIIEIQIQLEF